jgi:hypothetical protein
VKLLALIAACMLAPLASGVTVTAEIHQVVPGQVVGVDLAVRVLRPREQDEPALARPLHPVTLSHEDGEGPRITTSVVRDPSPSARLRVTGAPAAPGKVIQTVTLEKSEELDRVVRFEGVEPGRYTVIVRGAKPWHRAGERIDVYAFEAAPVHVQLSPFVMQLKAPEKSSVVLRHTEAFWEARFDIDDTGDAALDLWQTGPLVATVKVDGSLPFRVRRTLKEAVDTEWLLEMPKQEVVGIVVDAETGKPVPQAALSLEMKEMTVSVKAAEDGTFRFAPVVPGPHILQAGAAEYPVAKIEYTFGEDEETHQVTIAMERQPKTMLTVVDARGQAVRNADVHVFHAGRQVAHTRTGRDGTAPVFIAQKEQREVWIVPRDGSLAVTRIPSATPQTRVVVADGNSRIVARTESEKEKPVAGIMVDVRWNGLLIPDEVMMRIVHRGSRVISREDGRIVLQQMPPGTYELLVAGAKPLRIVAVPGETTAVMTFASAP